LQVGASIAIDGLQKKALFFWGIFTLCGSSGIPLDPEIHLSDSEPIGWFWQDSLEGHPAFVGPGVLAPC